MKKIIVPSLVISLLVIGSLSWAMGGPAPAPKEKIEEKRAMPLAERIFLIDDFESGSLKHPREWWTFDLKQAEISPNEAGGYSVLLKGPASNWYAGGCGTYLAKENQDLSDYNALQMDVFGNGPGSGTLKIEFFDDDNRNWQAEQDPAKDYAPIYDDKYVYDLRVDWQGWKRVEIYLDDFAENNPGVGDDIWNPQQDGGSGGLLQMLFICIAGKSDGVVNYNLDNICLIVNEE